MRKKKNVALGYRWVAVLDILGFRQMVETWNLNQLAHKVDQLFAAAAPKKMVAYNRSEGQRILTLGHMLFSDTIMLWTPPLNHATHRFFYVCHLFTTVSNLIASALVNGIALRGGLAAGECYVDISKHVVVGQPIVDAYLLEQEQEWLGAAVDVQQLGSLATFKHLEDWSRLVRYDVPTKTKTNRELLAIDWTRLARMPDIATQRLLKIKAREATENALSNGLNAATHEAGRRKWNNATEFLRIQTQRHPLKFREIHLSTKAGEREMANFIRELELQEDEP